MKTLYNIRTVLSAVIAGIVGAVANSLVVSVVAGAPLLPLIFSFGRETVAILVALLLPLVFLRLSGWQAWVTALILLTLIPSILAKTVFGIPAPVPRVLTFNFIYALAATLAYVTMVRSSVARA
ncbi:hypothetical protein [Roseitranquillus sediminis]|uniref:hypothetical protein n=1 Tax=Roseitranquillus sediminis TaxID=2809051 RepID=UPI001D0C9DA2|nr:hypothetical protein [Roseitranquillus sediminis]MBM9594497.1 hypothetical protein [Roseitranquillus sediminis]